MIGLVVGTIVPACLLSWAVAHVVRRQAYGFGLIDQPGDRKIHATPIPLGGGLAIFAGVVVPFACGQVFLWSCRIDLDGRLVPPFPVPAFAEPHLPGLIAQSGKLWTVLAGGAVLMVLGLVDDFRRIDWRVRIGIQALVAAAIVAQGFHLTVFVNVPWVTGVLSVLWIVGLVNAFNMLDNMDGLSAGVAAIAASLLAAVMLMSPGPVAQQPQLFVGGFLLVLVGALLGFLWHNRPPARLFMGDAGAYFIGYLLAMGTIMATFTGGSLPRHAILAPLCVLAVPLYDTLTVVVIRLRQGRSPFHADQSHFSHRLVELGLSPAQAVLTIYLTTITTGLGALLLYQVNVSGAAVILAMVASVLTVIGILETTGRRNDRQ